MKLSEIENRIIDTLKLSGSHYFTVQDSNGNDVKIRVSDHSANRNNNGDEKTLSFISARCNQGYRSMINEWVIDELGMTDTGQEISEVLEWELN